MKLNRETNALELSRSTRVVGRNFPMEIDRLTIAVIASPTNRIGPKRHRPLPKAWKRKVCLAAAELPTLEPTLEASWLK